MKYLIRRMTAEDAAAAAAVEEACFTEPWSENVYRAVLMLPYAFYFLAETQEGEVIGTIGLQNIGGDGEISNVAAMPLYRRQGIGHELMQAALEAGREAGIRDFTLEVRSGNTAAIALYESFGFETEGVRRNFYTRPTEDALIMWSREHISEKR